MKKKIIVYGCGEIFRKQKMFLEAEYDCIGYSDKCIEKIDLGGDNAKKVYPKDIRESGYDYVYICSTKYTDEIREELNREYHIPTEKILTMENMWWYVPNLLPRKRWIIEKLKKIPGGGYCLMQEQEIENMNPFALILHIYPRILGNMMILLKILESKVGRNGNQENVIFFQT